MNQEVTLSLIDHSQGQDNQNLFHWDIGDQDCDWQRIRLLIFHED